MIVADSDVLIDALRGREPSSSRIAALIEARSLATTAVNSFELLSGAGKSSEAESVLLLLGPLEIFPIDEAASRAAASVRTELEQAGMTIGMADYLIAGVCLANALPLLTRNHKHFSRVPGLLLAELAEE
jgi:tRNA(fMet)-specific endonuclease VapC